MNRTHSIATLASLTLLGTAGLLVAGPLNPPAGPVTSTGRTIQEVFDKVAASEPRIAISATTTPGDADSVYRITAPGSYYLTSNVTGVAGKHGIEVATNNVSIDLNNFAVLGTATSLNGITVSGARNSITVRNGTVTGWGGSGVQLNSGGLGSIVESVIANNNGTFGITTGLSGIIRACSASQNGDGSIDTGGIYVGHGGLVESCTADSNNGEGIVTGASATVQTCTVQGSAQYGIRTAGFAVVRGCSLRANTNGIYAFTNASVTDCSVANTTNVAIQASNGCVIRNNVCWNSGTPIAFQWGINVSGDGSRIEGNSCSGFHVGYHSSSSGSIYIRNTAHFNTTNWTIAAGNACYVVSATTGPAINGNNGGFGLGTADPNANFSY